jgi:hypothetical protein
METLPNRLTGRPKMGLVSDHAAHSCMVFIRMRPGVKHHPTVTQNGHTERDNPLVTLAGG